MRPENIEEAAEESGAVAEAVWDLHDDTVVAMGGRLPPQPGELRDGVHYPRGTNIAISRSRVLALPEDGRTRLRPC
jgi:hypothetical protein